MTDESKYQTIDESKLIEQIQTLDEWLAMTENMTNMSHTGRQLLLTKIAFMAKNEKGKKKH